MKPSFIKLPAQHKGVCIIKVNFLRALSSQQKVTSDEGVFPDSFRMPLIGKSEFRFLNRLFGFAMKREIQTRILTLKNPSSRRISIKNSNPRSHGFLSFTFFGKCKRVPVNSGLAICSLRVTISACLRSSSVHESKEKVSTTPICFCFLLQNLPSSH